MVACSFVSAFGGSAERGARSKCKGRATLVGGTLLPSTEPIGQAVRGHRHSGFIYLFTTTLGAGYQTIVPYIVMLIVLLVRPFGLFGTPEIRRV